MTPGELIRKKRQARSSLREAAKSLDVSPSYLSDIENDRRFPAEPLLWRIAATLGLDGDDLLARAGKISDEGEAYLRSHPTAGKLMRRIAELNLDDRDLDRLLAQINTNL